MFVKPNTKPKQLALIKKIISVYHPIYSKNHEFRQHLLQNPDHFNAERLVEECLAAVGGYEFIDQPHYDFSDMSDSKTASIYSSNKGEISNVQTAGGTMKVGALRCIIYNPHNQYDSDDDLLFYFLPESMWSDLCITRHPTTKLGKIQFTYNPDLNDIKKFMGYKVSSFEELAKAK